jgi:hypothetical protein
MSTARLSRRIHQSLSLVAVTSLNILRQVGFAKRPALQKLIAEKLGRTLGDDEFDDAMCELGHRIIRQSGVGGGIQLF